MPMRHAVNKMSTVVVSSDSCARWEASVMMATDVRDSHRTRRASRGWGVRGACANGIAGGASGRAVCIYTRQAGRRGVHGGILVGRAT